MFFNDNYFQAFTNEAKSKRTERKRKAAEEAKEVEQLLKEQKIQMPKSQSDLASMIMKVSSYSSAN